MHNKSQNKIASLVLKFSILANAFVLSFLLLCSCFVWGQQIVCVESIKHYAVDTNENNGMGTSGSTYNWNVTGGNFLGVITPTFAGSSNSVTIDWKQTPPGTYTVSVIEVSISNCSTLQSLIVQIKPNPIINLNDAVSCVDSSGNWLMPLSINTGLNQNQYNFIWHHDDILLPNTTANISVMEAGLYNVDITNIDTGCVASDKSLITISSAPVALVKVENQFENEQKIIVTILGGLGTYEFSIDGNNYQDSNEFNNIQPGYYNVSIRDKYLCGNVNIPISVIGCPKFFTPNEDGINDYWNIIGLPNPSQANLYIFDRYGKLIKQIKPTSLGWDGTYNGVKVPSTDYWFTLEYYDELNKFQIYKSHFSLKK